MENETFDSLRCFGYYRTSFRGDFTPRISGEVPDAFSLDEEKELAAKEHLESRNKDAGWVIWAGISAGIIVFAIVVIGVAYNLYKKFGGK